MEGYSTYRENGGGDWKMKEGRSLRPGVEEKHIQASPPGERLITSPNTLRFTLNV